VKRSRIDFEGGAGAALSASREIGRDQFAWLCMATAGIRRESGVGTCVIFGERGVEG